MNKLDSLYEITLPKVNILQRKISIQNPFTILCGASKSGKTYLIYDYLSQFESHQYLYINLNDMRLNQENIFLFLDEFILANKIETLVLENFNYDYDLTTLNSLQSIIITPLKIPKSLPNFISISIMPLDFEEYILFDNKHQNTVNSFNSFLKYGNLPEIIHYEDTNKLHRHQEILKLATVNQVQLIILQLLIKNSGEIKSIFQLYNIMKKDYKISKDLFYDSCNLFEQQFLVFYCQKYQAVKAPKKIFCYNHALIDSVNLNKNFNNIFSNMIFLELVKRYTNIYYLEYIDFYIQDNNSIVLSIPFFNNHISLSTKILPSIEQYNIKDITIVTINTEKTIYIDDIECEVLPFYSWAMGL